MIKGLFFSLLIVFNFNPILAASLPNKPASLERYAWIGGNKDGTVVAFTLSYFGPSSGSPFVKLIVKKADEAAPIFSDQAYMTGGGEKELAELSAYLIEKNTESLKALDIKLSSAYISEAHVISPPSQDATLISGWIDIENIGLKLFTVHADAGEVCPYDETINTRGFTFKLDKTKKLIVPPNSALCGSGSFVVRNVFRTPKALWFVVYQHAFGLGQTDTWWLDVQGMKF